jgi:predicted metal-dependent phosphotriesterase family hydrolase/ferredoxin
MATGLHLAEFYPHDHWRFEADAEEQARRFLQDITFGVPVGGPAGTVVRSGIIKIATSTAKPVAAERVAFEAAALAHVASGAPILVHTPGGRGALEQVEMLTAGGVEAEALALSHVDRRRDVGYLAELLATGVNVVLDQATRVAPAGAPDTAEIVLALAEAGLTNRVILGHDHGRRAYWRAYGGGPGMAFIVGRLRQRLLDGGMDDEALRGLLVDNPRKAFSFVPPPARSPLPERTTMRCTVHHDLCQGHGLCFFEAEELFEIRESDGKAIVLHEVVPEHMHDLARAAEDACPERAISLTED